VIPVPVIVTAPGFLFNVHVPVAGSPLRATLPVDKAQVGCVIAPITGAVGADGAGAITASADTADIHPSALVIIKLYVPAARLETVVETPVPLVKTAPGFRVKVHVPVTGKPLSTTLPVETEHVRFVINPIVGADGIALTVNVYVAAAATQAPPTGLFVVTVIKTIFPPSAAVGV